MNIPIIRGTLPATSQREYKERMKYESGEADQDAMKVTGEYDNPWLNVVAAYEPGSLIAVDYILSNQKLRQKLTGNILDLGAGTCWLTAKLSRLNTISEVVALDLSERFLCDVGMSVIEELEGDQTKIEFACSTFNDIPFDNEYFDNVFLVASIHHSITPIQTLLEAKRVLKFQGTLFIIEAPQPIIGIEKSRRESIELTKSTGATEISYTRKELEYMIRFAGFEDVCFTPVGSFSTNPVKKLIRKALRRCSLEEFFFSTGYVITASKTASSW